MGVKPWTPMGLAICGKKMPARGLRWLHAQAASPSLIQGGGDAAHRLRGLFLSYFFYLLPGDEARHGSLTIRHP